MLSFEFLILGKVPTVPGLDSLVKRSRKHIGVSRVPSHDICPQQTLGLLLDSGNLLTLPHVPQNQIIILTCRGEYLILAIFPADRSDLLVVAESFCLGLWLVQIPNQNLGVADGRDNLR